MPIKWTNIVYLPYGKPLSSGTYKIQVYAVGGAIMKEFGFKVK
jgi:hypothetical protein